METFAVDSYLPIRKVLLVCGKGEVPPIETPELLETSTRLMKVLSRGGLVSNNLETRSLLFIITVLLLGHPNTIQKYCEIYSIPLVGGHVLLELKTDMSEL